MDCKKFQDDLMELILTPGSTPGIATAAHMNVCPPCAEEYVAFQNTFNLLDAWKAPAPTAYFDQKLAVQVREEQAAPRMNWFEALSTRLRLNTGRNFRPAMVGALSLALVVGGGSVAMINPLHGPVQASATVRDLQLLDRNEQAFQQMDELQQEDSRTPQQEDNSSDQPTT